MVEIYGKPPVDKATLRVQFTNKLSRSVLDEKKNLLLAQFEKVEPIYSFELRNRKDGTPSYRRKSSGHQFFEGDGSYSATLTNRSLQVTQSGNYLGWEALQAKFLKIVKLFEGEDVRYLGTNYGNKITIRFNDDKRIELREYFKVFLSDEFFDGSVGFFSFRTSLAKLAEGYDINVNCKANRADVKGVCLFDLNVEVTSLANKSVNIMDEIIKLRETKDLAFEALLTDKTREMFR